MYVVTGASGNTGSVVAKHLLENNKQVRVIGRNAAHLRQFTDHGAEAVIADLTETSKLVHAFKGAEAVYAMIPPDLAGRTSMPTMRASPPRWLRLWPMRACLTS